MMVNGKPHWVERFPSAVWPAFEDFRNFLCLVWDHLGLPSPTEAQLEIAHRLQYGADSEEWKSLSEYKKKVLLTAPREDIIRCYRGAGKSYTTAAYVIWRLMRCPRDEKILVVSATGSKAKKFVAQVKGIISTLDLCTWLFEGPREKGAFRRDAADEFDVAYSSLSQDTSVRAAGITGQITGGRATLIVGDDIEIEPNSRTEDARQRLIDAAREFDSIAKTEFGKGDIIFLGTPQTEESIYNVLVKEQRYPCFTIPIRFPRVEKLKEYVLKDVEGEEHDILAYYLRKRYERGEIRPGQITDPERFTDDELLKQEAKGRAYFALQFMLDTSLSDADRYPLRLHDLIIFSLNPVKAPITLQWGRDSDRKNIIKDLPNIGFSGDHFLRPLFVDDEWREYEGSVLFVDPSGRGKDETAWSVVMSLGGMLFHLHTGALSGDPAEAMLRIAQDAKRFNVNVIEVEPNYGQGMWVTAFQPILSRVWPGGCTVQESEWAKGQKETRIIDTLEPVLTQHRLVMAEEVARRDLQEPDKNYSLLYQLTHITRERGSLKHDDRLDSLAGAVAYWQRTMAVDGEQARQGYREAQMDEEIEDFLAIFEDGNGLFRQNSGTIRRRGPMRNGSRDEVYMTKLQHLT